MNKNIISGLLSVGVLTAFSVPANAALDFTGVTAAVDATTIVAAISAIAAVKMLPGVARWGFTKVISWFN
jgi:hypothetical protein